MFIKLVDKLSRNIKFKIIPFLFLLILITPANSDPIIENEVDDLNLVISQFVGGSPNALFIMDVSGSMGRNFGGSQVGDWTLEQDGGVLVECEQSFCGGVGAEFCDSFDERVEASHCAENAANVSECGSKICSAGAAGGTCTTVEQLDALIDCVGNNINPPQLNHILDIWCGNGNGVPDENTNDCGDFNSPIRPGTGEPDGVDEIEGAAAAIEAQAGLTQCSSLFCSDFTDDPLEDPSCNLESEYVNFRNCMLDRQEININTAENCTAEDDMGDLINPLCEGQPAYGSSRLDVTLSVIFDLLDADDSINESLCVDDGNSDGANPTNTLFDGSSTIISCGDYMNTPFRNVRQIVRDFGDPTSRKSLPISGEGDNTLINYLTTNDAEELNIRLRPLTYSGESNWSGCTSNRTFQVPQGGFSGGSDTAFKNAWRFFRRLAPEGGTPLALVLGFDDNNGNGGGGGNVINDDALGVFRVELQTDQAIECRPEFIIILTDGEDTCSGDCDASSSSCSGSFTTNANRRSVVQAASNARTYYTRNPFANQGEQFKKEIMTFVVGLGIPEENAQARRTINAAAMVGGTSTLGIIEHIDPAGNTIGNVSIDTLLPGGSEFNVFKNLAKAIGLNTIPSDAQLKGCLNPDQSPGAHCHFQNDDIFDNAFFDTGAPLPPTGNNLLDGFAFFPQNALELQTALETIFGFINAQTSAGVAPGAPQSSTSIALRDRIFLSLLTPITQARVWQGRLGLYGFVDDLSNPGNKIVVTKPPAGTDFTDPSVNATLAENFGIFDTIDGTLIDAKTQQFHWEAAKLLTERELGSNPRRAFTVDLDFADLTVVTNVQDGVIRYLGDRVDFDNSLTPEVFGISEFDVFNPIPLFCQDATEGFADCNDGTDDCNEDITNVDCQTCVKDCIRDRVVDFMLGNTQIIPEGDPMGGPQTIGTPAVGETIGIDCPDLIGDTPGGSFSQCSVRLGDIFNSNPIVVGSPSALFFDVGFPVYAQAYRDRSSAVYVGANDGGFHSFHAGEFVEATQASPERNPFTGADSSVSFFDEGTGWEMFYYIPPSFLPDSIAPTIKDPESHLVDTFSTIAFAPDYRFGDLKSFIMDNLVQRAFFDGSPLIFDAWIDGYDNGINDDSSVCNLTTGPAATDGLINQCGNEWHSVMIAGYRNGGGAYTALDVTNPKCNVSGGICSTVEKFGASVSGDRFSGPGQEYPKHLWTVFDRDFGNTWSNPTRGRVRMKTQDAGDEITADRWLVFVGGGINPFDSEQFINPIIDDENFGNAFYAIDVTTGQIVYKFHPTRTIPLSVDTIPNNGNIQSSMVCEMGSDIGVFDINVDGYVDIAYGGDTCGRLWRFDISQPIIDTGNNVGNTGRTDTTVGTAEIEAQDWSASIAFCANEATECGSTESPAIPQNNITPIYFAPTTVVDVSGRRHVIFTTGSRRDPSNITKFGKLYNFVDNFIPSFLAGGVGGIAVSAPMLTDDNFSSSQIIQLVEQTGVGDATQFTTTGGEGIANQGEFIVQFPDNEESINGEKGIGTPVVINRVLIFTSFAPDAGLETNPCTSKAGEGRIFALDFLTGEPALRRIPGAESLIDGTDSQQQDVAGLTIAEGIPSPARLTFGARGSVLMTVAFSGGPSIGGAQFLVWELPPFPSRTQTLFWEEII